MYQFDSDQGGPLVRTAVDEYDSDDDSVTSYLCSIFLVALSYRIIANDSLERGGVTHDDGTMGYKCRASKLYNDYRIHISDYQRTPPLARINSTIE